MYKYCFYYDTGEYEYIDEHGYSQDRCEYVYNYDRTPFNNDNNNDD